MESEASVGVGLLEMTLELLPRPTKKELVREDVVVAQIKSESAIEHEREKHVFVYAKAWWKE